MNLVRRTASERAIRKTSGHEIFSLLLPATRSRNQPAASSHPPSRCQQRDVAALSREGHFFVGFYVFPGFFYEANRGPRRATPASTYPSKPVRPHKWKRTAAEDRAQPREKQLAKSNAPTPRLISPQERGPSPLTLTREPTAPNSSASMDWKNSRAATRYNYRATWHHLRQLSNVET